MLTPSRRRTDITQRRLRRGVYLLPSLMTLGNMYCGYACIVYAMRGEYETAAPFIGVAMVLDMLDGRIALGTWQSICLVDTNGDNPERRIRLSFLPG